MKASATRPEEFVIVGVDPGLTKANPTGYAVLTADASRLLTWGEIRSDDKLDWLFRANVVARELERLIFSQPTQHIRLIGFETPYVHLNVNTAMKLAYLGGAFAYVAHLHDLPLTLVHPSSVKKALTGYGVSDKAQMIDWVYNRFKQRLTKDAADAVGVALAALENST